MANDEPSSEDPLDNLLHLENTYYNEGYNLGLADGAHAGRTEGRIFGLEKGLEKFTELGRLQGKSLVWGARLPDEIGLCSGGPELVSPLSGSERLKKHVQRLRDLTDPDTLEIENSEEAVADFDERLKDARSKAGLIEKIVGEDEAELSKENEEQTSASGATGGSLRVRTNASAKQTRELEDFAGLPHLKKQAG